MGFPHALQVKESNVSFKPTERAARKLPGDSEGTSNKRKLASLLTARGSLKHRSPSGFPRTARGIEGRERSWEWTGAA